MYLHAELCLDLVGVVWHLTNSYLCRRVCWHKDWLASCFCQERGREELADKEDGQTTLAQI